MLSACEQIENFELFDTKKKLPGERKPVFPDGVPGVTSGVPPEMMKGYREVEGTASLDPAKAAAEAAAAEHEGSRTRSKPPPVQRPASKPATVASVPAASTQQPKTQQAKTQQQNTQQQTNAQQPSPPQGATLPWPGGPPQQQAQPAWPTGPGTATR